MRPIRFIMVGGFLGAGKTTTMARLARHYQIQGKRVGVVTNDQADNLVDTANLRARGLPVVEVPGACFCCKFDELVTKVGTLAADERPDIILAEPVGSCTDLVATVIQPLRDLYSAKVSVAPYVVLFKPSHGTRILRGDTDAGFSPKAAYIFLKQLEEADAIVLNRIDELNAAEVEELTELVSRQNPGTPLLRVSAKTGAGFDTLVEWLEQDGAFGQRILDIDYDTYAEGEAELGWLNCTVRVTAAVAFDLDAMMLAVIRGVSGSVWESGGEIAHLKVIGMAVGCYSVANVVSRITGAEVSLPACKLVDAADVIVNARASVDPAVLQSAVERQVQELRADLGIMADMLQVQALKPGRPTPTHRYRNAPA